MSQREVVVLSGVRTAIADFGGSLKDVPPTELAGQVVAEAVKRSGLRLTVAARSLTRQVHTGGAAA